MNWDLLWQVMVVFVLFDFGVLACFFAWRWFDEIHQALIDHAQVSRAMKALERENE